MLKSKYDREDQIPDNLKGAYVADASGVWVLDDLDAEHPTLKKNSELLSENTRYKGLNTRLQNEKTQLESRSIPEGYVAVKSEDAPIIEQVKSLNLPVAELPKLKEENDRFKQREIEANALNLRRSAAEKMGYNPDAFARLAKDLDVVAEGEEYFVNLKGDGGKTEKKPLTKEFVEASDDFRPFLDSLTNTQRRPGNGPDPKPNGNATSVFDRIREGAKSDAKPQVRSIDEAFGRAA